MKTKLITLLTLLLTVCSGAWGALTPALPATTLTLPTIPSEGWKGTVTPSYYNAEGTDVYVFSPYELYQSVSNLTWTTHNNGGSSSATPGASNPFPASSVFTGFKAATLNGTSKGPYAYRVTNCIEAYVYVKSGSDKKRTITLAAYEINNGTVSETATTSGTYEANSDGVITISSLDATKEYYIKVSQVGSGSVGSSSGNSSFYMVAFKAAPSKEISSQAFNGVKVGGTALTENASTNGYSVSGSTITLTNDLAVAAAPTNVTLTNLITYSDESTSTDDVEVSFGATASEGYFSGTAMIDETEYTVKIPALSISTQAFNGVKIDGATATETTDYTIDGTTITLVNSYLSAPAVALINHITYNNGSTDDQDVDVALSGPTSNLFSGTATIGSTTYTVNVPYDVTPTIELTETSGSITMEKSYTVVGTKTVTLTGSNLTDGEYTVTADETGTTISPASFTVADGAVSQEFTITTSSTTAATTIFTFGTASMGATAPTYTLTYSKPAKRDVSQSTVTGPTIWDWSKAVTTDADVLLTVIGSDEATTDTDPKRGTDFLLGTLPEIDNDDDFNSQALMVNCQYAYRSNGKYFQGNTVSFNTSITGPARVDVYFSNTSTRKDTDTNRRYLYINGTNTDEYTLDQTFKVAGMVVNDASTITISAKTGEATPAATMIRISKIVFTPQRQVKIAESGYTSMASSLALDFENAEDGDGNKDLKAYVISNITNESVTLSTVNSAPMGTGVILKGTAGATYTIPTIAEAESIATNELSAAVTTTDVEKETVYVVSGGELKLFTGTTIPAGKAYLLKSKVDEVGARSLSFFFDDETTGISNVEDAQRQLLSGDFYNLAGQRVAQPAKGLYIVNGRKVVIR